MQLLELTGIISCVLLLAVSAKSSEVEEDKNLPEVIDNDERRR